MPTIEISAETFEKLKALAEPLVDTAESVIARLVETALANQTAGSNGAVLGADVELDPDAPANLAFTRVYRARLAGEEIPKPNWNRVLRQAHIVAFKKLGSLDALRRASGAHIRPGRYEKEGFSHLPEVDFSLQGLDSNLAWENSLRVAKYLGMPIEVEFEWYNKDGAAHPGKSGRIGWEPNNS